jgi:hypothetical protein
MKLFVQLIVVSMLMTVALPAQAESYAQIFHCQQDDEASDQKLEEVAAAWLKAAKGMKGGEDLTVYLRFPVVGEMGEYDFAFVVVAPSLQAWGEFMGGYNGSAAEKVDEDFGDLADCPDSTLWEAVHIE